MDIAITAFVLSTGILFYVLFGYPLLLRVLHRENPIQIRDSRVWPAVSIVLPVRSGGRWIRAKLEAILSLDYPKDRLEILVVDDNSTDQTAAIAREFEPTVRLLKNPGRGKAMAINHALQYAAGEILFFTDVRQYIEPRALRELVATFDDPRVGVASGELMIRSGQNAEQMNVGLYWKYEKWIRKRLSAMDSVIGATGAIYAMRRSLARPLPPDTLLDDVHLPMAAFFRGYRVIFVEQARAYDDPTDLDAEFRRKVRTLAGVYQLIGNYPALLGPRNRMWLHFMSHKFGRLTLPFTLIVLFVSSMFLPQPWSTITVAGQIGFYLLAALDRFIPSGLVIKRLTSIIRTFVVMTWAAFCATSILFRRSESFWRTPTTDMGSGAIAPPRR
jgi:cellulose synthase/poly-beta-1,6-N-acetylglucosamine synthase-like glycosyltransferase